MGGDSLSRIRRASYGRGWRAGDAPSAYRSYENTLTTPWWRKSNVLMPILFALLLGWVGLLLYHPYFHIRTVIVDLRNDSPNAQLYRDWMHEQLRPKHALSLASSYFFFNEQRVQHALLEAFPLESVIVSKDFPSHTTLTITEKRNDILLIDGTKALRTFTNGSSEPVTQLGTISFQGEGNVATSSTATSTPDLSWQNILSTTSRARTVLGSIPVVFTNTAHIPPDERADFTQRILHFTTLMRNATLPLGEHDAWYIRLDKDDPYAWVLVSPTGWRIIVDTRHELSQQLLHAKKVLDQNNPSHIEYIDVRFYDTVYVKSR